MESRLAGWPPGEEVEALVGALGAALAGEHPGRQLGGAFEREDAGGVGKGAWDVLQEEIAEDPGPGLAARQLDLGDVGAGERDRGQGHPDLTTADRVAELVASVVGLNPRPDRDELARVVVEIVREAADLGVEIGEPGLGGGLGGCDFLEKNPEFFRFALALAGAEDGAGADELVELVGDLDLRLGPLPVVAGGAGDVSQIAGALAGDHRVASGLAGGDGGGALEGPAVAELGGEGADEALVEGVDAVIVELAGDGAVDRELFVRRAVEELVAAAVLLADVAQGVEGLGSVELVDGYEIGVVEHVDLLELHGGAVLGGHHIQGQIRDVDDLAVGLADA